MNDYQHKPQKKPAQLSGFSVSIKIMRKFILKLLKLFFVSFEMYTSD